MQTLGDIHYVFSDESLVAVSMLTTDMSESRVTMHKEVAEIISPVLKTMRVLLKSQVIQIPVRRTRNKTIYNAYVGYMLHKMAVEKCKMTRAERVAHASSSWSKLSPQEKHAFAREHCPERLHNGSFNRKPNGAPFLDLG